jgi:hypothetical protein
MSGTLDKEALRAVIRDVLREIVPAAAARAASRPAEQTGAGPVIEEVTIAGDRDLQAFVARVLRLCDEPDGRAALRDGRHRFRLRAGSSAAAAGAPADGQPQRIDAGVLSESKVIALARGGRQVMLGKRVVVTPLARDKARQLGLKLEREK